MAKHRLKVKAKAANDDDGDGDGNGKGDKAAPAAPVDERAADSKLKWAACLKRAFFFDVLACSCGGRRKLLAVVQSPGEVERFLRHVHLWNDGKPDAEILAIRGPPGEALYPAEEARGPEFDCVDEPPVDDDWQPADDLDWAA